MGPRDVECTMEVEEEIAQITSTLARANDSWSWMAWIELVKEEKLYLGVNLPRCFAGRSRFLDLERLNPNVLKHPAFPIPRGADKFRSCRVISANLSSGFCEVLFQAWLKL